MSPGTALSVDFGVTLQLDEVGVLASEKRYWRGLKSLRWKPIYAMAACASKQPERTRMLPLSGTRQAICAKCSAGMAH